MSFTWLDRVKVKHKPCLSGDNGPCYISGKLGDYMDKQGMTHIKDKLYHPQTQGKIELWHRTMEKIIHHHEIKESLN